MNILSLKTILFFDLTNEFDTRTYLRDCADIFVYGKEELESLYPVDVFNFLKMVRIVKCEDTPEQFLEFINHITTYPQIGMKRFIVRYIEMADEKLNRLFTDMRKLKMYTETVNFNDERNL